jgi:hypothetical protein
VVAVVDVPDVADVVVADVVVDDVAAIVDEMCARHYNSASQSQSKRAKDVVRPSCRIEPVPQSVIPADDCTAC